MDDLNFGPGPEPGDYCDIILTVDMSFLSVGEHSEITGFLNISSPFALTYTGSWQAPTVLRVEVQDAVTGALPWRYAHIGTDVNALSITLLPLRDALRQSTLSAPSTAAATGSFGM